MEDSVTWLDEVKGTKGRNRNYGWKDGLMPDSREHWMISWEIHALCCRQWVVTVVSWVREKGWDLTVPPGACEPGNSVGCKGSHTWKMPSLDLTSTTMFNKRPFPLRERMSNEATAQDVWEELKSEHRGQGQIERSTSETDRKKDQTTTQRKHEIQNMNVQGSYTRWSVFSVNRAAVC